MRDEGDADGWAAGLRGRETDDGFLVLEGSGGLRLAAAGEHAGPHLMLGAMSAEFILLMPGWCDAKTDRPTRSDGFGSWCLRAGGEDVAVHVYSDQSGVRECRRVRAPNPRLRRSTSLTRSGSLPPS